MTRILYVEDNDDNIYMLKLRFELLDSFEMLVAENGETGCAMALSEQPDIIIMDLDMPVVDGARPLKMAPAASSLGVSSVIPHSSTMLLCYHTRIQSYPHRHQT